MKSQATNVLIATGIGVAVGAALGILFAPEKGTKTRKKISNKVNDLKNKVASVEINPSEILESLKSHVESGLKNGKAEAKKELLDQIQALEKALK